MKPKTTRTPKTTKPRLSLRAQVLFRNREGQISDVTHQNLFGLKKIAEDGALALHILNQCRKTVGSAVPRGKTPIRYGCQPLCDLLLRIYEASWRAVAIWLAMLGSRRNCSETPKRSLHDTGPTHDRPAVPRP